MTDFDNYRRNHSCKSSCDWEILYESNTFPDFEGISFC
jgi:hypothetical protein